MERSNVFYFLTRHREHTSTPSITFFGVTVFPHRLQKYGVIDPVRHWPPPPEPESRQGLKWDLERFGIMGCYFLFALRRSERFGPVLDRKSTFTTPLHGPFRPSLRLTIPHNLQHSRPLHVHHKCDESFLSAAHFVHVQTGVLRQWLDMWVGLLVGKCS